MLYPLKFQPVFKTKIWGGDKIKQRLNKQTAPKDCGESWEIADLPETSSEIINGFLAGNSLNELVEVYMGDLVGESVYDRYGNQFPLLIKFIDAKDDLSIQVHPDDEYAQQHGLESGKTEMWYILEAEKNAKINVGFNQPMNKDFLEKHLKNNTIEQILNYMPIQAGNTFFIPSGKVHAICKGTLLAEIQQTSDTTFRLYDYQRKDKDGHLRPLHVEQACQCIHFDDNNNQAIDYKPIKNGYVQLVSCPYFTTNMIEIDEYVEKSYIDIDSFVIYICLEGKMQLKGEFDSETVSKGECVLIPAEIDEIKMVADPYCRFLEVYIPA